MIRKKSIVAIFLMLYFLLLAMPSILFALTPEEEVKQEQVIQRSEEERRQRASLRFRELSLAEEQAALQTRPSKKRFIDKFDVSFSYLESFDRNANFDSAHKKDWTQQMTLNAYFRDVPFSWMRYQIDYRLDTALHQHFEANDSFTQEIGGKTDFKILKSLFLDTAYHVGYFRYPSSTQSSYLRHQVIAGLKHYPFRTQRFYHRPNFTWEYRDYRYRKARTTVDGLAVNTATRRRDITYRIDHEIGIDPWKTTHLVVHNQIGFNDSNDGHQDFYDYAYFRTSQILSGSYKKWYAFSGFQFQHNNYTARQQQGTAESEDLPTVFGGIFYTLSKYLSVGFNASYFSSDSNYPDLEYSGATFTLGFYSNFKPSEILDKAHKIL
ncbi:MAG: hypothetical protein HYZ84_06635 [Candidatus Omnitrophica bacterium]|nr:hypothetical protein [Candidatus Omnitrophota bacterium]